MTPPAKLELRIPEKMSIREGMRFAAKELVQLSEVSECV
jgi:hypothetical protein